MITRSHAGIYKPRIPFSLSFNTHANIEPQTLAQASKDPRWVQAMNEEYDTLMRETHGHSLTHHKIVMLLIANGFPYSNSILTVVWVATNSPCHEEISLNTWIELFPDSFSSYKKQPTIQVVLSFIMNRLYDNLMSQMPFSMVNYKKPFSYNNNLASLNLLDLMLYVSSIKLSMALNKPRKLGSQCCLIISLTMGLSKVQ